MTSHEAIQPIVWGRFVHLKNTNETSIDEMVKPADTHHRVKSIDARFAVTMVEEEETFDVRLHLIKTDTTWVFSRRDLQDLSTVFV